jgi:energy-converting hydrogenase B subunit I
LRARDIIALAAFMIVGLAVFKSFGMVEVEPGINGYYNVAGGLKAPNIVSTVLFDFRAYDTLGECLILVAGVIAASLVLGRGRLSGDDEEGQTYNACVSPIIRMYAPLIAPVAIGLAVYVVLGGHITPGGGFQGGAIIGALMAFTFAVLGRKPINLSHDTLLRMESFGLLAYILLGVFGLYFTGSFLYNIGSQGGSADLVAAGFFAYPDSTNAGIIPYLNVFVFLKVSAGLTTIAALIMGVRG